jgi:hypothetical protein
MDQGCVKTIGAEFGVTMALEPEVSNVVDSALKARSSMLAPRAERKIQVGHHACLPRWGGEGVGVEPQRRAAAEINHGSHAIVKQCCAPPSNGTSCRRAPAIASLSARRP